MPGGAAGGPAIDGSAIGGIPVISGSIGAGGIAAQMVGAHDMAADAAEKIERHADKPGHPVGLERIETVMTEQRALRDEVTAQGRSIAAICQATGARCD